LSMAAFFDINKLPKDYGILVFPISIARTDNGTGQDPNQCLEYVKHFSPSKVIEPKVGLNLIYGDFLYFHSKEEARTLKQKFMNLVLKHKNTFQKLVRKERERFQIQDAFAYEVWNQLYLSYEGDFDSDFREFKRMYSEDALFQKYVKEDVEYAKRELTEDQINFFLEEHLISYLLSKKRIFLPNQYIQGREQWVLWCYPGAPMKAEIYTYQKNPFNLEAAENLYQNHVYDLESKKLIDCLKVDLESYNYTY
jgi:hypothetical protein